MFLRAASSAGAAFVAGATEAEAAVAAFVAGATGGVAAVDLRGIVVGIHNIQR